MIILLKPVLTEKSMAQVAAGKYIFEVLKSANSHEIAQAVKTMYKVEVTKVNIINVKGEKKLVRGRFVSQTSPTKKAILTLKKGQKIPDFEEK